MAEQKDVQLNQKSSSEQDQLQAELKRYRTLYTELLAERNVMKSRINLLQTQVSSMEQSASWRITKPLRAIVKLLKKWPVTRKIGKGLICLREHGFRYTWARVRAKFKLKRRAIKPLYAPNELEEQRKTVFPKSIKFSILVPLYNTPEPFLKEMLESVLAQTYSNWELCLADGSDAEHTGLDRAVAEISQNDPRVIYRKLEKNLGISGNTNACIDMSSGDYIALFDHDDVLHPAALFDVMRAICEQDADFIYTDENTFSHKLSDAYCPHYKPNFSPDLLRSYNYICHFTVFKRSLLERTGGFRSEFDGSQDYDMILRLTEVAQKIVHVPKILYYWRAHQGSVASDISAKPYTVIAAKKALAEHLKRVGLEGEVLDSVVPSTYRISYTLEREPLISILIPNMDHADILERCIESIEKLSTYRNFEILIVENNSVKPETFLYYESVCDKYKNIRVIRWEHEFNYSKINNFAAQNAKGEYLVLLNNDVEILTPEWLEEMLMFVQRKDVGAAGMLLYYPDDTVQHAGVILGIGGVAGHSHKYFKRGDTGYMSRLSLAQNLSAVTAACMMVKTEVYHKVGGLNEDLAVAFNDVDFCMKIRREGYLIVFTPYAEAYHYESKSRGLEDTPEKQKRFRGEMDKFISVWNQELEAGDPYYNPNLSITHEDFSVRDSE